MEMVERGILMKATQRDRELMEAISDLSSGVGGKGEVMIEKRSRYHGVRWNGHCWQARWRDERGIQVTAGRVRFRA